jgi:hypothetical protein
MERSVFSFSIAPYANAMPCIVVILDLGLPIDTNKNKHLIKCTFQLTLLSNGNGSMDQCNKLKMATTTGQS